jgi:hypothetical protein
LEDGALQDLGTGLLHLSLKASGQDFFDLFTGEGLAFQERLGEVFDSAAVYGVADELQARARN